MESYSSSIEQQTSLDRPELPGSMEQTSMSRSQSAPMLDDELGFPGHGGNQHQQGQNQKPAIPHKAYHFDQNYNPQVSWSFKLMAVPRCAINLKLQMQQYMGYNLLFHALIGKHSDHFNHFR